MAISPLSSFTVNVIVWDTETGKSKIYIGADHNSFEPYKKKLPENPLQ